MKLPRRKVSASRSGCCRAPAHFAHHIGKTYPTKSVCWDCWVCPLGLSANVPMATSDANESLLALLDGKWVNLRVPYAMGYYAKWMDGRIDDPLAH
jgi:hypothetical protein